MQSLVFKPGLSVTAASLGNKGVIEARNQFRCAGSFRRRLGVPVVRACGLSEATNLKAIQCPNSVTVETAPPAARAECLVIQEPRGPGPTRRAESWHERGSRSLGADRIGDSRPDSRPNRENRGNGTGDLGVWLGAGVWESLGPGARAVERESDSRK
jgi:hypothetical protein